MKFCVAILALFIITMETREAATADSANTTKGYYYVLPITLEFKIDKPNQMIETRAWDNPGYITYTQRVDRSNPIYIKGDVDINSQSLIDVDYTHSLEPCNEYKDGTWDYVVVKLIVQSVMPNGGCPIDPGKYKVNTGDPINVTVTFNEMIECGIYDFWLTLVNHYNDDLLQASYRFNTEDLSDDYKCKP